MILVLQFVSLFFQLAAFYYVHRLSRLLPKGSAWGQIVFAMALIVVRRLTTLYILLTGADGWLHFLDAYVLPLLVTLFFYTGFRALYLSWKA
ncbi:MAG: hypothetical protein [Siphoviridae sp. ctvD11]|nr:MAG: hypothetical protein [Siphoviridae sp. ctvD11]